MKTMGLLAGMSWESSSVYYQLINRQVQQRLGGVHSAKALIYSFDFDEVAQLQQSARWEEATMLLSGVGRTLASGGADFLAICCNTMHLMAAEVEQASGIPLLHIADPVGEAAKRAGVTKLGLLGTRFTMDEPRIIAERLRTKFGLEVVVPDAAGREIIDSVIQTELIKGVIREESRARYRAVMENLVAQGCEAIILGCTEIPLLVSQTDASVPLYDTMQLHASAIVDFALA
ncbi:MAG TPA: aspartate/glutamate racemase family protein [Rhizomicrobium sp.]|jgi:aspartate racemase